MSAYPFDPFALNGWSVYYVPPWDRYVFGWVDARCRYVGTMALAGGKAWR